jgi:hypothetical protein
LIFCAEWRRRVGRPPHPPGTTHDEWVAEVARRALDRAQHRRDGWELWQEVVASFEEACAARDDLAAAFFGNALLFLWADLRG